MWIFWNLESENQQTHNTNGMKLGSAKNVCKVLIGRGQQLNRLGSFHVFSHTPETEGETTARHSTGLPTTASMGGPTAVGVTGADETLLAGGPMGRMTGAGLVDWLTLLTIL